MTESITPYVKITNKQQGGFGDLPSSQDIEMNNIQDESKDTDNLTQSQSLPMLWDSICKFDLESCFVSYTIPCHIIGKAGKEIGFGYPSLFFVYGFFFVIFNYCYFVFSYGVTPICPNNKYTDWCFILYDKTQCIQSYTKINSDKVLCKYNHEYHTCYASDYECISKHDFTITWSSWCFLEVISLSAITIVHVFVRRRLKQKQRVSQDTMCKDILYALYCSSCSLAQQYRNLGEKS
tara:strand:- start:19504 stop:20211 length:708 start_codon:yes stop_codon:yes gene_type:complete